MVFKIEKYSNENVIMAKKDEKFAYISAKRLFEPLNNSFFKFVINNDNKSTL
jgi:hypothetical protein